MKVGWYRKRWLVILIHVVAWVLLFSLPTLLKPSFTNVHAAPPSKNSYFYHYSVNFLTWTCLFYINAYILIPRFINAKKYQYYFLSLLGIISICLLINWLSFRLLLPEFNYNIKGFAVFYLFPSIFFLATSTVYKMLLDRNEFEKKTKERETENLKTELSFLRSQVSPHFMFNVLNNMVALARKKSDLLEPSLIKLSSLLRYMLYETSEDEVSLDKEIEYLQSYIDLQLQRFGKNIEIKTCLKDVDRNYHIEPMLLIPFVENAFKHGTGFLKDAFIHIKLSATNNVLKFVVSNSFNGQTDEIKDKSSGIGLNNVKRRLNLLYASNHTLDIQKKDHEFIVTLYLNLH